MKILIVLYQETKFAISKKITSNFPNFSKIRKIKSCWRPFRWPKEFLGVKQPLMKKGKSMSKNQTRKKIKRLKSLNLSPVRKRIIISHKRKIKLNPVENLAENL